jgi:hypothetical protein
MNRLMYPYSACQSRLNDETREPCLHSTIGQDNEGINHHSLDL